MVILSHAATHVQNTYSDRYKEKQVDVKTKHPAVITELITHA